MFAVLVRLQDIDPCFDLIRFLWKIKENARMTMSISSTCIKGILPRSLLIRSALNFVIHMGILMYPVKDSAERSLVYIVRTVWRLSLSLYKVLYPTCGISWKWLKLDILPKKYFLQPFQCLLFPCKLGKISLQQGRFPYSVGWFPLCISLFFPSISQNFLARSFPFYLSFQAWFFNS